jgi:hypothetical protein
MITAADVTSSAVLYPGQTDTHLQSIGELDDRSIDSMRTLTSFESVPDQELDE